MSSFGVNEVGQIVAVKLFAKVAYVDIHYITCATFIVLVDLPCDFFSGKNLTISKCQAFQKKIFFSSEIDDLSRTLNIFFGGVDDKITNRDQG